MANLFVWIDVLRPSQPHWSFHEVASVLWDFYPTLGCHDTQNVLHKYKSQYIFLQPFQGISC